MDLSLSGKNILICGAGGLSGRSLAQLCLRLGARVILSDRNAEADLNDALNAALREAKHDGSDRLVDARPREDRDLLSEYQIDMVITGPGVPLSGDLFAAAGEASIKIRGENDFASEVIALACERAMLPAPLIAGVTGTDGKSTTVAMLERLVNQATGLRAIACGNYGLPLSQLVLDCFPEDGPATLPPVLVVECSSFQLELVESFHPDVAVVLNIADDHLDRYVDRRSYLNAKLNIVNRQNERDVFLAPQSIYEQAVDRPYLHSQSGAAAGGLNGGGVESRVQSDFGDFDGPRDAADTVQVHSGRPRRIVVPTVNEEPVPDTLRYRERELLPAADFPLPGIHNQENLRFALKALECLEDASVHYLRGMHVNLERLATALRNFRGLPHRMEICVPGGAEPAVDERVRNDGRPSMLYLNDSKATTVQAVVAALASFPEAQQRVFLLCGGRAKGADFGELGGRENVELFPYGEAGAQIAERTGTNAVFADLESAFIAANQAARAWAGLEPNSKAAEDNSDSLKDSEKHSQSKRQAIVLLSPACASYDAYSSYQSRGEHFRELVERCPS
ncbi:MAG: UDP-N-acetylmuramoyl-L-alanine--D-glutamate ligase [bacterium]|nr:UDP-N-acetylmuramoyl-L-alanine--D-glutamate ligase [bacterium]